MALGLPQTQAQQLVKAGQLQFIVGGWTMQDEACTTYDANIDQMTEGHLWIRSVFGEVAPLQSPLHRRPTHMRATGQLPSP